MFADQTGSINLPVNNAASNETITFEESQTPFTDQGGDGNIPAPPSGQTAVTYVATYESPEQTINFTPQTSAGAVITITASAPCEILAGHTYVAYVYANGSGFPHSEISPSTGFPTTQTVVSGVVTISFQINLSGVLNMQPSGVGLETVFADTNTTSVRRRSFR
jgi:hypothetical protein